MSLDVSTGDEAPRASAPVIALSCVRQVRLATAWIFSPSLRARYRTLKRDVTLARCSPSCDASAGICRPLFAVDPKSPPMLC